MSEQIGLRRDAAFAEPRSERSTAVKCTQADHYISTTARSDTWVLPIRLSLFKSLSWTAVQMRVANRRPCSVLKGPSLLSEPNRFKYLYCFFSALSVHADSPPSLRNAFFLLPHCFAHHFVLPLTACLCVCAGFCVCVRDRESCPAVCASGRFFRSILQCRCRCSFLFHSSAWLGTQRRGRKSGCSSIKGLVCPLWCDAAVHFGYKDAAFLSLRSEK